jgi:hypothetical protein
MYAREYVHVLSAGDLHACEVVFETTGHYLSARSAEDSIRGYNLLILENEQDCRDELVKNDWKSFVGEVFPIVYAFVQPSQAIGDRLFDEYLRSAGFERIR